MVNPRDLGRHLNRELKGITRVCSDIGEALREAVEVVARYELYAQRLSRFGQRSYRYRYEY